MYSRFVTANTIVSVNILFALAAAAAITLHVPGRACADEDKPPKITYEEHVQPILRQKCFSCHNPDKKSGDLDMTNYTNLMQGGGSGAVIEPGDSSSSYLYGLVTHQDEPFMPPESPKIPDEMIDTIRKWIDGGALENAGSVALMRKKPKFNLALTDAPTERPEVPPVPPRMSLEPVTRTDSTTAVSALATSPWSPLIAVAGHRQVLLYHSETLQLTGVLPFPEGVPQVIQFSRNGSLLLVGGGQSGASGRVVVWNVKTSERLFEIGDELDTVLAADISSDQTLIALGGPQRVVRIYSTETGKLLHELRKHTDWIQSLEFSPDSVLLATGDRNGGLFVWEGWTGREYLTLKGHGGSVTDISWRSDSNVVASCSEDNTIRLWEMENGGQIKNWGAHGGVASIEFARDGRIVSCGRDRVTRLWNQDGGEIRAFEAAADLALRVTFCDETNRAIAGDWTGAVLVFHAEDGAKLGQLSTNPPRLSERLDAASQQLGTRRQQHDPLAAAYQTAQAEYDQVKSNLDTARQNMAGAQSRLEAANTTAAAVKKEIEQVGAAQQTAASAALALEQAVPPLLDAATKAQEAASKLDGDNELAEAAARIKAIAEARASQLAGHRQATAETTSDLESAKAKLTEAEQVAASAEADLKTANDQLAKLQPLVPPAEEKATAAKQAADASAAALEIANNEVVRWTGEIEFTEKINSLYERRAAAREQLGTHQSNQAELVARAQANQAELEQAMAELAAGKQAIVEAQQQFESSAVAVEMAKQARAQAMAAADAASQTAAVLEQVVASLNEAVVRATETAAQLPDDPELAGGVESTTTLAEKKTAQLNAMRTDAVEKVKVVEAAQAHLAEAQQAFTEATAAVDTVRKREPELAARIPPAHEKAAAAQKQVDDAAPVMASAQQVVDSIQSEIAVTRGIQ